jgi:hypothetical protein
MAAVVALPALVSWHRRRAAVEGARPHPGASVATGVIAGHGRAISE